MILNLNIKKIFFVIFLIELLSALSFFYPIFNKAAFLFIAIIALILTIYKLEYGVWLVITELLIGSKSGYLFFFDSGGAVISIRIALWLIVCSVWLAKFLVKLLKEKKAEAVFIKSTFFNYFFVLGIFVVWGLINGFLKGNDYSNLFLDFNGWLYFALIFPIYEVMISGEDKLKEFLKIFLACSAWIIFKTFFILFIFSHNIIGVVDWLYRWIRLTGVGEVVNVADGFYRIFLQSQIFILISFFISLFFIFEKIGEEAYLKNKKFWLSFLGFTSSFSVILISLSRSYWVSIIFTVILFYGYVLLKKDWRKKILSASAYIFMASIASILLIIFAAKFPFPRPMGDFSAADILSERALALSGEAAVSSRWSLLPKLWSEIKKEPILGQGFGATVTYESSDPRVLETNINGEYTTYVFEWSWLDVWLKLGFFGFLTYLVLVGKIFITGIKSENKIILALSFGLLAISIINIFSPYFNHPLGIGYLILCSALISKKKRL